MGTRADFYVGRGKDAEWLGSIGWDGYPAGVPAILFGASDEADYRTRVATIAKKAADQFTTVEMGWPWPWVDSGTTDYAYAWDSDRVWYTCFGRGWRDDPADDADWPEDDDPGFTGKVDFPDMSAIQNVTYGSRSGLLVFGVRQ